MSLRLNRNVQAIAHEPRNYPESRFPNVGGDSCRRFSRDSDTIYSPSANLHPSGSGAILPLLAKVAQAGWRRADRQLTCPGRPLVVR